MIFVQTDNYISPYDLSNNPCIYALTWNIIFFIHKFLFLNFLFNLLIDLFIYSMFLSHWFFPVNLYYDRSLPFFQNFLINAHVVFHMKFKMNWTLSFNILFNLPFWEHDIISAFGHVLLYISKQHLRIFSRSYS
jgi:hypothetical protein